MHKKPRARTIAFFPYTTLFRSHHAFSDREGDPHSPWLFGTSPVALARAIWHAHIGWLFGTDKTHAEDRKSTRLNSSHMSISYAVYCLKKNNTEADEPPPLFQES